jgi:hypothetical protein
MSDEARPISTILPTVDDRMLVICWCGETGTAWESPKHAAAQANRFDAKWPACIHLERP